MGLVVVIFDCYIIKSISLDENDFYDILRYLLDSLISYAIIYGITIDINSIT